MDEDEAYRGQSSYPSSSDNASVDESTSSGTGYYYQERAEGYDYDFVPAPDPKYECAICLLILREPRQTKCGHRFCRDCIVKWLRESETRCPVDNETIVERDLFPDNFAKREIQNFKVRCPNFKQGCDALVTLKKVQEHTDQCPLALVPCPNNCTDILLRRDIPNHKQFNCPRRILQCQNCQQDVKAELMEQHLTECPLIGIQCQYCEDSIIRQELQRHHKEDCPKFMISCDFAPLGCNKTEISREDAKTHYEESVVSHQRMLCNGVVAILNMMGIPNLPPESVTSGIPRGEHSPVEVSASLGMMVSHLQSSLGSGGMSIISRTPDGQSTKQTSNDFSTESDHQKLLRSLSESAVKSATDSTEEPPVSYSSKPSGPELKGAFSMSPMSEPRAEIQSLKNQNYFQDESLARHDQQLMEIQAKNEMLEKANKEMKHRIKLLDNVIQDFEGRSCEGQYYWRIKNYTKLLREAEQGINTAVHSPSFYSSCYGYKLCIRANLNGVDTAKGNHLSLFIHFMQGEWDDILDWPFTGRIILSIIDQNVQRELRTHVTETLIAKPTLAAFQRPVTPRNHKGFGYMEFVPQSVIETGYFVRNDTMIIRAQVIPTQRPSN